jgi:hypothetical protein
MTATLDTLDTLNTLVPASVAELTAAHRAAWEALRSARAVMVTAEAVHGEWSAEWETEQAAVARALFVERAARKALKAAGGVPCVDEPATYPVPVVSSRDRFDEVPADVMHAARRAGRVR